MFSLVACVPVPLPQILNVSRVTERQTDASRILCVIVFILFSKSPPFTAIERREARAYEIEEGGGASRECLSISEILNNCTSHFRLYVDLLNSHFIGEKTMPLSVY